MEEEKEIMHYNNGDKYEVDLKNYLKDGKGIYYYYKNYDICEGRFKEEIKKGKKISDYNNGAFCEEDNKNDLKDEKEISYFMVVKP